MLEGASLLSVFFAFALLHGAASSRRPRWTPSFPASWTPSLPPSWTRAWTAASRLLALCLVAWSFCLWARAEDATEAALVVLTALSVAATLFVLLAPLYPRLVWGVALACAPAVVILSALGGLRG